MRLLISGALGLVLPGRAYTATNDSSCVKMSCLTSATKQALAGVVSRQGCLTLCTMPTKRIIPKYYVNTRRDRQYDEALRDHLGATWKQPGRTHTQIAKALGCGNPSTDKAYGFAIMYALHDFAERDDETISWYPNLKLPEAALEKKREKSKHNDYYLKFYKHSPYRKMIDRDPSRTDEIVGKIIHGFLKAKGSTSGHGILEAMQIKLGHVARSVVERCLASLIADGDVIKEKVNPTLTLHRLP